MAITPQDAQQIKQALVEYLATSKQVSEVPFLNPDSEAWVTAGDDVWFDEDKLLHIGLWRQRPHDDRLALVYRPVEQSTRVGFQYLAHLIQTDEGRWQVSLISFEKIFFRR